LPATLLASFVKRLSRLALHAPPAALVAVVPFTYNLLKRHPALMVLIHRPPPEDGADPFDTAEYDPHKTGALGSSLWELRGACARHFHAPVGALFRVLEQPFTRPALALDDFADHGYTTLFETEVRKRVRQPPVVTEHKVEGCLFPWLGDSREVKVDIVAELWSFGA
jgi:U3 small nucleolar RNA-associated protein 19